ncbi:hypothetical protein HII36_28510 [Nonomuraea sp. NN258]|uniref:hypothetical protein n=1 Tax=Nonomuraea antri TaxID=2730852 RepID=UPI001568C79D|nr:hypothetical protein [Nonomuraea antri]NRQ35746.1 hypothetical protein [Nonomuraea antri]
MRLRVVVDRAAGPVRPFLQLLPLLLAFPPVLLVGPTAVLGGRRQIRGQLAGHLAALDVIEAGDQGRDGGGSPGVDGGADVVPGVRHDRDDRGARRQ